MIEKFSASYNGINPNFIVDIGDVNDAVEEPFRSLFSVCRNILNRDVRVGPSQFLRSNYPGFQMREDLTYSYSFTEKPCWKRTIKGGTANNPALRFYETTLPSILKSVFGNDGERIYCTFLPECNVNQIIKDTESEFAVDFYSPLLRTVIEIDGSQHLSVEQSQRDRSRDKNLELNNIRLVRITTTDIARDDYDNLRILLNNIKRTDGHIVNYTDFDTLSHSDIDLMYIIRIQMALILLLTEGKISLSERTWKIGLIAHEEVSDGLIQLAWADMKILMHHISVLMGLEIEFPDIDSNDPDMIFDISAGNNYSENDSARICIRNDYYAYDKGSDNKASYCCNRNHFRVSNGSFRYSIRTTEVSTNHWIIEENQRRSLLFILNYCFGYNSFRKNQEEIIANCLNGQSVIGVLPTSAGKSLCYQLCAMLLPGSTLVISPLKSLMEDQFNSMAEFGIGNTVFLNGDNISTMQSVVFNNRSLVTLISPERFFNTKFTGFLSSERVKYRMIVIDEVHCISEWGHDFRTSYLCLFFSLSKYFPKDSCLIGLTATASPNVCEDIIAEFNTFRNNTLLITADSLEREELVLHPVCLKSSSEKEEWLKEYVKRNEGLRNKAVVFTKFADSKKDKSSCVGLCSTFKEYMGLDDSVLVDYFRGGSNENNRTERDNSQKLINFKDGDTRLLFATKAFGMGINIADIRNTIHFGLSASIESIYQEFGRAGRDGKRSDCYILFEKESPDNIRRLERKDLTIKEIDRCRNEYSELRGNLYFMATSNMDPDTETDFIWALFQFIRNRDSFLLSEIKAELVCDKTDVEKGLYRLLILGIVNMWSMIYSENFSDPMYSSIKVNEISIEEGIQNLESYIRRYDYGYIYSGVKGFKHLLNALLKWSFDNFVRNRIESMRLLYEYCDTNTEPGSLMDAITDFLTTDPGLKGVLNNEDPDVWFNYIDKVSPESRKHKTDRYMEVYHNDVALNFISAITAVQIATDLSENGSAISNFSKSLEGVVNLPIEDKRKIVVKTYELLVDKDRISATVPLFLKWMPECARTVLDMTDDDAAKVFVLKDYDKQLREIVGALNVKV